MLADAQNNLADSILGTNWNWQDKTVRPNSGAWDNGVLMDPGRPSYSREMVAQTQRRLAKIPHFQGMVVDRSDYSRYYNLEHDDGVTLTPSGQPQSWSMKRSYLEVIAKLRAAVGTTKVMLMNSLGYSSLSMMPSYDGTFSRKAARSTRSACWALAAWSTSCGRQTIWSAAPTSRERMCSSSAGSTWECTRWPRCPPPTTASDVRHDTLFAAGTSLT